jgi:sec-independent protein translocase protein TatB
MFGIGTSEVLIILLIALLILGPKEIPRVARTIGRGMRELDRAKDEFRKTIEFEANENDNENDEEESGSDSSDEQAAAAPEKVEDADSEDDPVENLGDLPNKRV